MQSLAAVLDAGWDTATAAAWHRMFRLMAETMLEGSVTGAFSHPGLRSRAQSRGDPGPSRRTSRRCAAGGCRPCGSRGTAGPRCHDSTGPVPARSATSCSRSLNGSSAPDASERRRDDRSRQSAADRRPTGLRAGDRAALITAAPRASRPGRREPRPPRSEKPHCSNSAAARSSNAGSPEAMPAACAARAWRKLPCPLRRARRGDRRPTRRRRTSRCRGGAPPPSRTCRGAARRRPRREQLTRGRKARPLCGEPRVGAVDVRVEQTSLADFELGDAVEVDSRPSRSPSSSFPHATRASAHRSVAPSPRPRLVRTSVISCAR